GVFLSSRPTAAMTLAFDHPGVPASPLARMDPRWKLLTLLLAAGLVCALRTWPPALVALLAAVGLGALARLPLRAHPLRLAAVADRPAAARLPAARQPAQLPDAGPGDRHPAAAQRRARGARRARHALPWLRRPLSHLARIPDTAGRRGGVRPVGRRRRRAAG